MIISYSRRFIFVHIHKTGGDSITAALAPFVARSDVLLNHDWPPWAHKLRAGRNRPEYDVLRKHSPAGAIARALPADVWAQSFTFAFVRHPIGRTISLYQYASWKLDERRKLLPRNAWYLTPFGRWNDPLRWRSIRALHESDSFSDFIRHPLLERDASMVAQWHLLTDRNGHLLVDFVGRYERLQQDFHEVQDRIPIPRTTLMRRNVTKTGDRAPLVVSKADRAFLEKKFEADFSYFTYDPCTNS